MKEFWEEVRRKDEFLDECRRKWKEQGKTEEECKRMWPQAFADWRAETGAFADLEMQMQRLGRIEDSAEQLVKHH